MNKTFVSFVLCMVPLAGHSQTLTTSSEYGLPIQLTRTEINQTGTLSKFDSNLGTLTGASLTLYAGAQFDMSLSNAATQSQEGAIEATTRLIFSSDELSVNNLIQAQKPSIRLSASSPITTIAVGQTINFEPYARNDSFTYDLSSVLASVQSSGGGNFTINARSLSGFSIEGGGGNLGSTVTTVAGAGAEITYIYEPIPEPTSALLFGIAGLGLLVRRRR